MAKSFTELKKKMSPQRQRRIEERAQAILLTMALQELRKTRHLTQQDLASTLDVTQAALSKMENQTDIRVSTLSKLLSAMGGTLKIVAEFPDGEFVINQFEKA